MSVLFSGRDMLEIAVNIERNGEAFYQVAARSARRDSARTLFSYLASEETKHRATFQSLLDSLPAEPLPETYSGEYALYVKALADNRVFTDEKGARALAAASNELQVIDLALGVERDSLLLYWEMRGLLRRTDSPVVDRIMDEERAHVRKLTEVRGQLGQS